MDHTKGLAMISYTEGRDATHWMNMPEKKREKEMMKALRALYPTKEIPDPLAIKFHGWRTGCTYWTPVKGVSRPKAGDRYDAEEESNKSVEPLSGLYLCSESFAVQQSWMESALIQAEKVLTKLLRP
jgi:monoamine oxidase